MRHEACLGPPDALALPTVTGLRGLLSSLDAALCAHLGLSAALHLGVLATLSLFMPPPVWGAAPDRDDLALIQHLFSASAESSGDADPGEAPTLGSGDEDGTTGVIGKNENRTMGSPSSGRTGHRYGVAGPTDNADPHIAREAALREVREIGMVGLLRDDHVGEGNGPTAPWGRGEALGTDPGSASGNMWGDAIGDAFGGGGLGITGIGEGSGGRGEGIRIGSIGTIGEGKGTSGSGYGSGCGCNYGHLGGSHTTHAPVLRCGGEVVSGGSPHGCDVTVNGRLPPEVIQRIVRQSFGRFRLCYENALRTSPNLQGRITVKFVIGRDGSVSTSSDAGSDLVDEAVVSCVVRRFGDLSFPQPEGGIVTVVYPIVFNPGE